MELPIRIFRDSITPAEIPLGGLDGVFLYANGRYAATNAQAERFTAAGIQVAHIDVTGTDWEQAAVLDVEQFDATPAMAPGWIRQRNAFRGDAVIYCDLNSCADLFAATSQLAEDYWLWVADWTGVPHLPAMTVPGNVKLLGVQYKSTETYDESAITAAEWHPRAA